MKEKNYDNSNRSNKAIMATTPNPMPAPKLNQNARKDSTETTWLQVRCHPTAKAAWRVAAGKAGLSKWVKQTLNKAVEQKDGL